MPIWPFSRKRRKTVVEKDTPSQPLIESEKAQPRPVAPKRAETEPGKGERIASSSPIPIPRRSSKRGRPTSAEDPDQLQLSAEKENVPPVPGRRGSREDITALPMSYKLEQSPHLRPVDLERPHIPYNFRTYSGSQTSIQRESATASPRPNVLRKKRSSYESTPQRQRSTRTKKEERLREEEIRAMSSPSPQSKRPGEGPLRKDSKKIRSGLKDSNVSLPPHEESIHETLSGISEQRGWEIGSLDIFNPRPAVRLSGTPQYVTAGSLRSASPISPEPPRKYKERAASSRDTTRKRDTIGNRADELDASDLRTILERDTKRREKRKQEHHEKLDRKLRSREGRSRGDVEKKRAESEEVRRIAEAKARAEKELEAREAVRDPAAVHPALREQKNEVVGLGIGEQATAGATEIAKAIAPTAPEPQDPFADPAVPEEEDVRMSSEQIPGTFTPAELHTDEPEPVLETAQAVRMSQASTPPLSPVYAPPRATSALSQVMDSRDVEDVPAPVPVDEPRRKSQPVPERRAGTLASLFRRGGTTGRKASSTKSPTETSFANLSRESMRNQPLPPHLVDTQAGGRVQVVRRTSGTPVRTQSRFREDLPGVPLSPPDSRVASPEVATPVTARAQPSQPIDVPRQGSTTTAGSEALSAARYDTPISPSLRHGASLASVDSEGAWLASSGKRQSKSAIAQRRPEFTTSYEELGVDADDQYFSRAPSSPETLRRPNTLSPRASQATSDREFFDAPEDLETPEESQAYMGSSEVHGSVQRHPTVVQRDLRVKSREGLLDDYAAEVEPASATTTTGRGSFEFDSDVEEPEPELQRASSIRVHQHKSSTGSARLLDVFPKRNSAADILESEPTTPR